MSYRLWEACAERKTASPSRIRYGMGIFDLCVLIVRSH